MQNIRCSESRLSWCSKTYSVWGRVNRRLCHQQVMLSTSIWCEYITKEWYGEMLTALFPNFCTWGHGIETQWIRIKAYPHVTEPNSRRLPRKDLMYLSETVQGTSVQMLYVWVKMHRDSNVCLSAADWWSMYEHWIVQQAVCYAKLWMTHASL